jgi:hypothetical protein
MVPSTIPVANALQLGMKARHLDIKISAPQCSMLADIVDGTSHKLFVGEKAFFGRAALGDTASLLFHGETEGRQFFMFFVG